MDAHGRIRAGEVANMFQSGDKVEEIATGRQGKIYEIASGGPVGKATPNEWRVLFRDGKQPSRKNFHNEKELRSVPGGEPEPGISPDKPLVD
jgi:hypothetical protein